MTNIKEVVVSPKKTGKSPPPPPSRMAKFCAFCLKNKEPGSFVYSHQLRDRNGKITCPILQRYTCPKCKVTGEHTVSYCTIKSPQAFKKPLVNKQQPVVTHTYTYKYKLNKKEYHHDQQPQQEQKLELQPQLEVQTQQQEQEMQLQQLKQQEMQLQQLKQQEMHLQQLKQQEMQLRQQQQEAALSILANQLMALLSMVGRNKQQLALEHQPAFGQQPEFGQQQQQQLFYMSHSSLRQQWANHFHSFILDR